MSIAEGDAGEVHRSADGRQLVLPQQRRRAKGLQGYIRAWPRRPQYTLARGTAAGTGRHDRLLVVLVGVRVGVDRSHIHEEQRNSSRQVRSFSAASPSVPLS